MSNVPELRFPGLGSFWEMSPLGKLYPVIRNGFVGTATPFYVTEDRGHPYIQGKDIKDGKIRNTVDVFVSDEFYRKNSKSILRANDIVMVQSGHVGDCAVVSSVNAGANCHALIVMTPRVSACSNFYVYYFASPYGKRQIYKIKTGNTIEHILASDMKIMRVPVPDNTEQEKIAEFLSAVDEKIAAIERKVELLKQYKKAVMQKIFTQQIRFPAGNSDAPSRWTRTRLSELFERVTDKNGELNTNVLTISAQQGLVSQTDYFNKSVAGKVLSGYYLLRRDDFAYNRSYSVGYPMGAVKRLRLYPKGIVSTLYICFRAKDSRDVDFFECFFDAGLQNYEIEKVAQEGARNHGLLNISSGDFFNVSLCVPSSRKERQRIADFFNAIDEKAKSEEAKLAQAKAFKSSLLQRMFA